ncbi:MAG: phosphoribosylamine--glycine ligase [Candidatus Lambdaproteobacteria bacterium]|nr:phosphoribosylamine--glycine ligase [Candidatus Lambdaproteobacteria bacterium]
MKVLLVGGGGREHALAWKLARSPRLTRLYAAPGSAAIARLAECLPLKGSAAIVEFAARAGIDLTVVGPEAPLVEGLADALLARGLRVFGPTRAAAALEGSKSFAKEFMRRHGIPSAPFAVFDRIEAARAHIAEQPGPYVVKADGLAAGKGVSICANRADAVEALERMMVRREFGEAGARVVIEAFLPGEEASYFCISDGTGYVTFPACQDHKRIHDGDRGPNTGGMGAYCPAPILTPALERRVQESIVEPTLRGMAAEGRPYRGVLYIGLMIAGGEPRVVEYNCRFGDPECQPLMLMLESDLLELLLGAVEGRCATQRPRWRPGAAACIVMASAGYPGEYATGVPIHGLESLAENETCAVFHAGTALADGGWVTNGGRVLGVTAWDASLQAALAKGYALVGQMGWEGVSYRKDIGQKGIAKVRSVGPAGP